MKYLFLLLAFAGLTVADAQIGTVQKTMSTGTNTALTLEIPNADAKMVTKLWSDYLMDNYGAKTKYNRKEKEYQTLGVSAPALGSGRNVDMYTVVDDARNGSMLFFWINSGNGYIEPTAFPDQYLEAQRVLTDFQLVARRATIEEEVETEEDKLKDLEKELKKLEDEQQKLERDIEKAEETIRQARADIEKNVKEQADQVEAIRKQQEAIDMTRRKLTQVGRKGN